MHFAPVMNALVPETNALKARIQTSVPPPHTQRLSKKTYIEMIATHLGKWAVAIILLYSPPSTLHPQVIYTKSFSAGINGLRVD